MTDKDTKPATKSDVSVEVKPKALPQTIEEAAAADTALRKQRATLSPEVAQPTPAGTNPQGVRVPDVALQPPGSTRANISDRDAALETRIQETQLDIEDQFHKNPDESMHPPIINPPIPPDSMPPAAPGRIRKQLMEPLLHVPADVLAYDGSSPTAPFNLYGDSRTEPDELVTVTVPKTFTLHADDGRPVTYEAGIQEMPVGHVNHWYSRANGVNKYTKGAAKDLKAAAAAEKKKQLSDEELLAESNAKARAAFAGKAAP